MARSAVRIASLTRDDIEAMLRLFGTVANTGRQLGLSELGVTYPQYYRALHFETITPEQKSVIEEAWQRWRFLYLRPEVPESSDLTISVENRDRVPSWHPEHDEEDPEEEAPTIRHGAQRE
jgi:hypothetical protein